MKENVLLLKEHRLMSVQFLGLLWKVSPLRRPVETNKAVKDELFVLSAEMILPE